MHFDLSELSPSRVYYTMIQTLVPRPVAWVLSDNGNDSFNLAPFSYFNGVASDPPLIMLSVGKKPDGSLKDTRNNIIERSEFVIHIAHREMAPQVTETSRVLAAGESELDSTGLETVAFGDFRLPRLKDCRVALACERYRVEDITPTQAMILGEVKAIYVDDAVITEDEKGRAKIHADKIDPITRLGGDEYGLFGGIINVPRPK
ncbi:flavin reductase family protein [Oceanicoccus sagamiensis]|uniref:Protein/domain typically associated with flavoprotein oxygenase, DIM6/NTAB family protein n=1 Tax=Oceanicoccus sagamiensis TaxID=716816 RepID=A0A1X9N7S4_9GAMM|nr:flavin reductase family protein [Oceanicoccus sagamiensis]ARN73736.1 protein/domain typically associated with flavoprotein oxygenase, DIM6/NTAB family protein [Oceanicoccus sagamiensis]